MRKIFYILSISIFLNLAYSQCQGDVNDDYSIDVLDVVLILNQILGFEDLSDEELLIADLNGDGNIDVFDIITLVGLILNGETVCIPEPDDFCDNEYDFITGDLIACDGGCIEINNDCYMENDLYMLADFRDCSELFDESTSLFDIGEQEWSNGRLTYLNLNYNQLTSLPESIGNLSSLEELGLIGNQLTSLPESIGNLSSLEELELWNNQLTSLPESIGNLSSLEELRINHNQLTSIPESIGNLTVLIDIRIDNNQLTSLPESISDLVSLETLVAWENQLIYIPENIGDLNSLLYLDFSTNQLTSLPESICNLPDDCIIYLYQNSLCEEYHYDCIYDDSWETQDESNCDCDGITGGDATEDNCGTCDNDPSNDCMQDECGVWGGDGILEGYCDCEGNVLDCSGVCGGDIICQELVVWTNTTEEINDTSIVYISELYAQVLNEYNSLIPNIPILFNLLTDGVGSLDNSLAYTDSVGNAATVSFTFNTYEFPNDTLITANFEISILDFDDLVEELSLTYTTNGNTQPEYDVSEFHFYPDNPTIPHNQYDQTEISVIAKNDAGVGISNVLVRFSLEAASNRDANGEISHEFQYTCCADSSVGQTGVASITYTNIQGGNDVLTAYILDPITAEILVEDSITIINNEACLNCDEELRLITSNYILPDDNGLESTDIYAFYTDSLGNLPDINSFISFSAIQPDPEDNGAWIDVGSLNPQSSFFMTAEAGDLDDELFDGFPEDSTLVYATTTFNMETASGLVKIVGVYEGLTDTLGIWINSTDALFVEIIPPYPGTITVQGSPDLESTIITAEIRDDNGNLVSDSYITRFTLASSAEIAGVHFNDEAGLTDTYTYSSNGSSSITLNSGTIPVSVAMTVQVYEMTEITSVEDLDNLEIITEYSAVPVTVIAGPPSSGVIGYSFSEALNIGGGLTEIPISIMLWDTWANPVVDSTSVYFTLEPETTGEIEPEAKTNGLKPPYDNENAHWPGVAWTTITYNSEQLFEFPEIKGYTTGSFCADSTSSYEECDNLGLEWLTSQQIIVSSFANDVPYENVCVDCSLTLLPLSDTQVDWACPTNPNPNTDIFEVYLRANLTDFYLVPVEGSNVELIYSGTQGGPTVEAIQYLCYFDSNPENGEYDDGEEQTLDGVPLTQEQCDVVPAFTWGPAYFIEPPSDQVLTDNDGNKYWRVTFNHNECTLTQDDPPQYSCTSPSLYANLVNPNGATSEEVSVTILSTCSE